MHVLVAERNTGNFTYDGIELGGERLAREIEDKLEQLTDGGEDGPGAAGGGGGKIRKLSVVGYSLGGLIARYALGLLYMRGWLDKLQPVSFTTFATPHVGVRSPLKGFSNQVWNVLGARTVSVSGRQLFMIDSFRDTGKPLLSVLADRESIFVKALERFQDRVAYANVVNDRSAVFYTTAILKNNPFVDVESMPINYVKGYESVIVNPDQFFLPESESEESSLHAQQTGLRSVLSKLPLWIFLAVFIPIGVCVFLPYSAVQTIRSRKRIRLHEQGESGILPGNYRSFPLVVQSAVEDVFENVNARQEEYLSPDDPKPDTDPAVATASEKEELLALTPEQFAIIDSLDAVGFRRFPVYIHNHHHSHAAIIVRMPKKGFEEGEVVIKHWLDAVFQA